MISKPDFLKKQIIFVYPSEGDRISFSNDNIVIKDRDGKIKHQSTCYRLFVVFVVGDTSITTGLIQRAHKFGFTICLMNKSMKLYQVIGAHMEGNTLLHKKQYAYSGIEIGKHLLLNKIDNQIEAIRKIRIKSDEAKERLKILNREKKAIGGKRKIQELLGAEGVAARVYFKEIFSTAGWNGRKPRIKIDYINSTLDIGYTILFNFIEALLGIYDFDIYCGVLHTPYYMRKSLVCDLMEPMRYLVDLRVRKGINYGQIKEEDFKVKNRRVILEWKNSLRYTRMILESILERKEDIFLFIQKYYRSFMKGKAIEEYPIFEVK